jgi:hypothetical protein
MTDMVEREDGYWIQVVNIVWGRDVGERKKKEKPSETVLDVPEEILKNRKNGERFLELVETFAYNVLMRKYGAEVMNCQIYLPTED